MLKEIPAEGRTRDLEPASERRKRLTKAPAKRPAEKLSKIGDTARLSRTKRPAHQPGLPRPNRQKMSTNSSIAGAVTEGEPTSARCD